MLGRFGSPSSFPPVGDAVSIPSVNVNGASNDEWLESIILQEWFHRFPCDPERLGSRKFTQDGSAWAFSDEFFPVHVILLSVLD